MLKNWLQFMSNENKCFDVYMNTLKKHKIIIGFIFKTLWDRSKNQE